MKSWYKYLLITLAVIIIDQIVKVIVKTNMHLSDEYSIFGDWFKIHFIENQGAAFGMTLKSFIPSMTETTAKAILSVFSIAAVSLIVSLLYSIRNSTTKLPLYVSLILGGALGNIIDRLFYGMIFQKINDYEGGFLYGRVVDMFYLDIWQGVLPEWIPFWGGDFTALWPIFNIADASISIGIVSIIIFQNKLFPQKTEEESESLQGEVVGEVTGHELYQPTNLDENHQEIVEKVEDKLEVKVEDESVKSPNSL